MEKIWKFIDDLIRFILTKIIHLKVTEEQLDRISQFVQFGIVGLSNTLISYVVYVVLVACEWHYLLASLMGFLISVVNAFYWNNKYVFKAGEGEERVLWRSFIKTFTSYAGTGLLLHNILLILWVDILGMHEMLGPIINLFITIPSNFVLNKFWAFKKQNRK